MRNKSEKARVVYIILFLATMCLFPFAGALYNDWRSTLLVFGVPILSIVAFGLLSDKFKLSLSPKRLLTASYFVVAVVFFYSSAIIFYLANYSWSLIFLYSAGFSFFAVISGMISTFVWSKIKPFEKNNPTRQE